MDSCRPKTANEFNTMYTSLRTYGSSDRPSRELRLVGEYERWQRLRKGLNLSDDDLAKMLMDRYETSENGNGFCQACNSRKSNDCQREFSRGEPHQLKYAHQEMPLYMKPIPHSFSATHNQAVVGNPGLKRVGGSNTFIESLGKYLTDCMESTVPNETARKSDFDDPVIKVEAPEIAESQGPSWDTYSRQKELQGEQPRESSYQAEGPKAFDISGSRIHSKKYSSKSPSIPTQSVQTQNRDNHNQHELDLELSCDPPNEEYPNAFPQDHCRDYFDKFCLVRQAGMKKPKAEEESMSSFESEQEESGHSQRDEEDESNDVDTASEASSTDKPYVGNFNPERNNNFPNARRSARNSRSLFDVQEVCAYMDISDEEVKVEKRGRKKKKTEVMDDEYIPDDLDEEDAENDSQQLRRNRKSLNIQKPKKEKKPKKDQSIRPKRPYVRRQDSDGPKIYPRKRKHCPFCPKNYEGKWALEVHMFKNHGSPKPLRKFMCETCGYVYGTLNSLNIHKKRLHQDSAECSECHKLFPSKYHLGCHVRTVHKAKIVCCELCGEQVKSKMLKWHKENKHMPKKELNCAWPGCTKVLSSEYNMRVHMRIHTDEKPIACDYCDYRCRQRNAMNWHMKKTHPSDVYVRRWISSNSTKVQVVE